VHSGAELRGSLERALQSEGYSTAKGRCKPVADENYQKRKAEDEALQRRLQIESLRKMIAEMPPETRKEAKLVVEDRTFTPDEILSEIEKNTAYGELFLKMHTRMQLEQLRRRR
jgi:hypothetical protein